MEAFTITPILSLVITLSITIALFLIIAHSIANLNNKTMKKIIYSISSFLFVIAFVTILLLVLLSPLLPILFVARVIQILFYVIIVTGFILIIRYW